MNQKRVWQTVALVAVTIAAVLMGLELVGAQGGEGLSPQATTAPATMSYQGRLLFGGQPYSGTAYLKFAIVDETGTTTYWSNDGTSTTGNEPTASVAVAVSDGLFTVQLGKSPMTALSASVFASPGRKLRIWASQTGGGTFNQLAPDQPLGSVPYAFNAETLDGQDGSAFQRRYAHVVDVAPAGGDATDLAGATALITDSSPSNTYLIRVAPGTYHGGVTLPPYVHLRGSGINATVITATVQATTTTGAALTLGNGGELSELTVVVTGTANAVAAVSGSGDSVWVHHVKLRASGVQTLYGFLLNTGDARLSDFDVFVDGALAYGLAGSGGTLTAHDGLIWAIGQGKAVLVSNGGENIAKLRDVWGEASATTEAVGAENFSSQLTLENVSFQAGGGSGSAYGLYLSGGQADVAGSNVAADASMAYGVYVPVTTTGQIADSDVTAYGWEELAYGVYNGPGASLTYHDVRIRAYGNRWDTVGMSVYQSAPLLQGVHIHAGGTSAEYKATGLRLEEPVEGGERQDVFITSQAITDAYGIYVQDTGTGRSLDFDHAVVQARGHDARAVYVYGGGSLYFRGSDLLAESTSADPSGSATVLKHDVSDPSQDSGQFNVDSSQLRTVGYTGVGVAITGTVDSTYFTRTAAYVGSSLVDGTVQSVDAWCAGAYGGLYTSLNNRCQ